MSEIPCRFDPSKQCSPSCPNRDANGGILQEISGTYNIDLDELTDSITNPGFLSGEDNARRLAYRTRPSEDSTKDNCELRGGTKTSDKRRRWLE